MLIYFCLRSRPRVKNHSPWETLRRSSNFDFNFNTRSQLQFHQSLDGLVVAVVDVDQTLVARQLKLLTALLVNERRAVYREDTLVRRQWNWTTYYGTRSLNGLNDLLCRLVNQVVVERLQFDTNFLRPVRNP